MRFGVLGPLVVWGTDGTPVPVPELKVRALLAHLLLHPGHPVSTTRLVDHLWGTRLPRHPANALQGRVSQLRRTLERAEPGTGRSRVVSGPAGYALDVDPGQDVDAGRFVSLARRARAVAGPDRRAELAAEALTLWRGPAFADFAEEATGVFARGSAVERLEEERLTTLEDLFEARLELGEHRALAGELAEHVAAHPLRERLRALHMRALHRAGRQAEALRSYGEVRRRLATELGLDPAPELTALRDTILRHDGTPAPTTPTAPATPPTPATPTAPPTNLPAPLTGLVGRDAALAEVRGLLRRGRLVTLTGPGGVGKSRLAVEAARRLREQDGREARDGVWLVDLSGVEPSALTPLTPSGLTSSGHAPSDGVAAVLCAVTEALEIREEGGTDDAPGLVAWLTGLLRDRRMLLVLDDCERLVEPVAEVAEALLRGVPGLRVLATSREPLRIGGELISPVPPLDEPSAAALFLARAGVATPPASAETVARICRRLDGLPLALELAASRVRTLGLHGLLARLDDRFSVLTQGYRDAPARQRTLYATLAWSWELLGEAERAVLRRLSAFVDGCGLRAAEEVCAGGAVVAGEVLDLLGRLVDRSLVMLEDRVDGPRYRLLESVREFGAARLREAGEEADTRARFVRHHVGLVERATPSLRGREQRRWLALLDAESGNLRRALDLTLDPGPVPGGPSTPPEAALRLVNGLAWYWVLRGRFAEARRSFRRALAAATAATADTAAAPTPDVARALAWQAGIRLLESSAPAPAPTPVPTLALPSTSDRADRADVALARWFLAYAQLGTATVASGEHLAGQALAGFRALGDLWGEAASLSVLARHALARGDLAATREQGERAARLFRELGDDWGVSQTVFPLASLAEIAGDHARAAALHREGLAIAEDLGLSAVAVHRLCGLGRIAQLTGDHAGAEAFHQRALDLATERHFRPGQAAADLGLALGARRAGDLDGAEERLRRLRTWFTSTGYGPGLTLVLAELGFVAELRGEADAALALHEEGLAEARRLGDPRAVALALEGLAAAHAAAGRHERATTLLATAAATRQSAGAPLPPAERGDVDRTTTLARAALGDDRFTSTYATALRRGAPRPDVPRPNALQPEALRPEALRPDTPRREAALPGQDEGSTGAGDNPEGTQVRQAR
ncbi:AfsR/SARP family transcriptional regulator [Streptomyces sp. 4N509B]|uniref:AfsR/SARP family transcriptional regulator n=1 Tax=Streptomyces sp. 4N509B TaxID=3457413 RepID=UPI003FD55170